MHDYGIQPYDAGFVQIVGQTHLMPIFYNQIALR